MRVQVRLNAISPYQSQQSSPAIRDTSAPAIQETSSPAIEDTSTSAIQDISAPAIRGSSPAESWICNTPPSCYALWSKKNKQPMMPIIASLKPCVASEQGKSTTVAWGWTSIYTMKSVFAQPPIDLQLTFNYTKPIAFVNFVCLSSGSAFVSISATFSSVCT